MSNFWADNAEFYRNFLLHNNCDKMYGIIENNENVSETAVNRHIAIWYFICNLFSNGGDDFY